MLRIFDREVPFHKAICKIEARKWQSNKESFDQYALEKIALMHRLDLPVRNSIQLLIGGIMSSPLRATALSLNIETVDDFLEKMRRITEGVGDLEKRSATPFVPNKSKENTCRNCGKKGHAHKDCRGEPTCFYCKSKGHRQFDCPALKKKEASAPAGARTITAQRTPFRPTAAAVSVEEEQPDSVAVVQDTESRLEINTPFVRVSELMGEPINPTALIDTGSPVSFIRKDIYERHIKPRNGIILHSNRNLRNLNNQTISFVGVAQAKLSLEPLNNVEFQICLFILADNTFEGDTIIGREFLTRENLTLVYRPRSVIEERVAVFTSLPLYVEEESAENSVEKVVDTIVTDYGIEGDKDLREVLRSVRNSIVEPINDDYSVRVNLKDTSIYAYAPRRFAYMERLQIRKIIDDLIERKIIQPSVSPYCARIVPVRKRDGNLRMCIDLRPLNSRVEKQKYPFPLVEDCLSRLANKSVYTLLDLRDSFHQIKVHEAETRYFSFATPDGQYEYTCLPFGYSEAPAEFQKRLIQILNPLIREDKVIIYIDDVLIASENVDRNLKKC